MTLQWQTLQLFTLDHASSPDVTVDSAICGVLDAMTLGIVHRPIWTWRVMPDVRDNPARKY